MSERARFNRRSSLALRSVRTQRPHGHRAARVALWLILCVGGALACSDGGSGPEVETPTLPATPFIVSNPHGGAAGFRSNDAAASTPATELVYVSLPPGAIPNADQVVVRVQSSGATITAIAVDGGLDPVPIAAQPGDTLDLDVRLASGSSQQFSMVAPRVARPVVVRTSPPPRKRDVPLNMTVTIVFSESIEPSTLNEGSVRLFNGTTSVPGTFGFADASHLVATFTPSAPLEGATDYSLSVTSGIQDLDGESLDGALTVPFTTAAASETIESMDLSPPAASIGIGKSVLFTAQPKDASGMPLLDRSVTWSSSAPNIVTISANGLALGMASGTAEISATSEGFVTSARVVVLPVSVAMGQIAVGRCLEELCGLYVVDADGSNGRFLTTTPAALAGESDPSWSPDGRRIAVQSSRHCPTGSTSCLGDIYVMNADGSGLTNITNSRDVDESQPVWSPDGRRIAFAAASYDGARSRYLRTDIYTIELDGSGLELLVRAADETAVFAPMWSPDGTKISYTTVTLDWDYTFAIEVANADGSGRRRLTKLSDSEIGGAWSPDGRSIAFTRIDYGPFGSSQTCQVYVMDADGSNARRLTSDPFCASGPSWSPDGSAIALTAHFGPGLYGLGVMNADGSGGVALVFDGGFSRPAWSPVGGRATSPSLQPSRKQ